ncbi:MAG: LPS export ABC transporter permease LptG [Pseudobdellovibrionaceae bacterium]
MMLIDRYILKNFWAVLLGALIVFVTLFVAIDAMSKISTFKDINQVSLMSYYVYGLPEILVKMLPVACLTALMVTLSNLSKNNELVALFASGISLVRLSAPMLISVVLVSLTGFMITDQAVPTLTKQKNYIYYRDIEKKPSMFSTVKTNRIWYRSKNAIFNIKTLSQEGNVAQGLTLYFFSDTWDLLQMITASRVELSQNSWGLFDGTVTVFQSDSSFPLTNNFQEKTIVMSEDASDLQSSGHTSDMLSVKELRRFIDKNREAGLDTLRYEVEYHNKFSFASVGLIMCLLGLPFSIGKARSGGTVLNLGIAFVLVFVFWVLSSSTFTLGLHGFLSPLLSAWMPHILMSFGACVMIFRGKR